MSEETAGPLTEIEWLYADNAELRASAELTQRQWRELVAERTELCRQLDLAHDEIATLRDAHTAVLAWLDVRGAALPAAWRDELKEALNRS